MLAADRILPVVALDNADWATPLGAALAAGGVHTIEVTLRTRAALAAIRTLTDRTDLIVGAGTVTSAEQVDHVVDAGARFVVCPGFSSGVIRRCQRREVTVIPGVATPTEIQMALDAGLSVVKLFPAEQLGGLPMLKALAAPFPGLRFVPTGGVTTANLRGYLDHPAVLAVGGTWMAPAALLAAGRWDDVTSLTTAAVTESRESDR
ncbi:bifunctional 4-hydroxy-2-oxoglutarate aldolase/2-dehydro-3-deoxy-phosphogluconate aldolase [Verrucosispora sioxanthis]|uniref:2-dehydro-3-deoxy-phosphogluconate aldolase n=1 Tax=Verrucosispora sioxanthis TaxID=2499994 RepID=A0A6M1LDZ0_9ACTN|nr:bifunctional 4-hydroxy-2-oxoglutarate aldolase/2-dehydro-3-deoxy-phosphogluconate aldolase [Verrucosispora sioxanthis]NEE67134.1 bifunctional 4-hydroxy-2-oxoglutarate aldolase/2-dehydro-3-deoxy-phosphogluconate aldolase [Verrucosispora sioxanthis]NGM16244.1 bifunctional 4-hydroxy-2-oxoglutarate aldolase/2-dehydro-3-deoxy-phosphogluconate aldolase [Verrucosispora sioxanthis]